MLGERYCVVAGDCLWRIAARELGDPYQWPRIWRYNNRKDVIAVTGRPIPNPDLIYPHQILLIPRLPGPPPAPVATAAPSPQPIRAGQPASLAAQLPQIESPIAIKYKLDDIILPPFDTPVAIIEFRMQGDVVMMTKKRHPALYVTSRNEIEAQVKHESDANFAKLIQDNRIIYDQTSKQVTLRTMLVTQSKTPFAPATAIGVEVGSGAPIPKLRAEIRLPKLEGSIGPFDYVAVDVKFVILITPKAPPSAPSPQPIRVPIYEPAPAPEPGFNWGRAAGIGLLAVGTTIIVGTLVEDFFTAGAGVADDPVSFSAAAAAFARGAALLKGAALPAAGPAMVTITVGVAAQ